MSTTVDQVLAAYSPVPLVLDNDTAPSVKEWTRRYAPFVNVDIWAPTRANIEEFLGPGDNESRADFIGFQTPCEWPNMFRQLVETEGDVTRDFDQSIIPAVAVAFCGAEARSSTPGGLEDGGPSLFARSQLAAPGSTKVVDYQMIMNHENPSLDMPAMIGEMKKPRTIRRVEWEDMDRRGLVTARLQSELRAYAIFNPSQDVADQI
ncbi:hypothetical protein N7471_010715 [Penicillium samsonianum]|uniref:uncharacterized protein n=1 Tax=Penicillium samsonianum TaxID=1882272 RepID=UPI0025474ACC|nr:uncharacterized protein N7471_010715 [Penicillium samsonianum]KAJ6126222.1 hypothetical protein N7471_010715 [Penicillium samsonianum]